MYVYFFFRFVLYLFLYLSLFAKEIFFKNVLSKNFLKLKISENLKVSKI